ncbi:MAG: 3-isopropylmalate dehydratase small subunit [Rhizomicrobium sp.]
MEAFTSVTSVAAPMPQPNIDTDIIFPARFLLVTAKKGLGQYAFFEWRYDPSGAELQSFVLNREPFRRAQIIVAGDNFGCGSSREQAPWALRDLGIRCVISTSFGEIFYSNCFKNGILPVVVTEAELVALREQALAEKNITVDLRNQTVRYQGDRCIAFVVEPWRREALLNGWDEIGIILNQQAAGIDIFETRQRAAKPWLYAGE